MLCHPCILGGPKEGGNAMPPLHSGGSPTPSVGAKIEVVLNKGKQNQKWLPHPCLLGGPKEGGNATSPLHSRGSPTPSTESKIKSTSQQRGTKSEVAASALPCRGPKGGRKCSVTPTFLRVPNATHGEQHRKRSPTKGSKTKSGCLNPAFSGAHKRLEMLRHPCILGGPRRQAQGENQKWPFGFLGYTHGGVVYYYIPLPLKLAGKQAST